MSVHVEDDGLVTSGLDEGPEVVLVDLSHLAHLNCRADGVQAGSYHRTTVSPSALLLTKTTTTPRAGLWVGIRYPWSSGYGGVRRDEGGEESDRLPNGAWKRLGIANGRRRDSEVESHCHGRRERERERYGIDKEVPSDCSSA